MTTEDAFERYRLVLQGLTAENLHAMDAVLTTDVRFKDPLHDLVGAENMKRVFSQLFDAAENIFYVIDDYACSADGVYFRWALTARLSGKPWSVTGVTRATFDASGRVTDHVEYWDAASQLYEQFPVIGTLLRYARRRIARG